MSLIKAIYSSKDFFDLRGESYIKNASWVNNSILNNAIIEIVRKENPIRIIDLGSGDGQLLKLISWVNTRIAMDISHNMLNKITDSNIEKIIGDIHHIPLSKSSIDMIICRQVLHYCNIEIVFKEMVRILKNEGSILIVQITDHKAVPTKWYNLLKSFKQIKNRKHITQADIVNAASVEKLVLVERHKFKIEMYHTWENYFEKYGIEDKRKKKIVCEFLRNTPKLIKMEINLNFDNVGISYNRIFSYLLFKKQ